MESASFVRPQFRRPSSHSRCARAEDQIQPQSGPGGGGTGSTYQAESAVLAGGAVVESNHSGFNGTGFVNFPSNGGTLTFNGVDGNGGGTKRLAICYALGASGSRTGTITVNGSSSNITFNSTGSWNSWTTMNVNITLNNNSSNTIQFASTGQDLANLDEITVP